MSDEYIHDPQSFADYQNNVRLLKARISQNEAVIEYMKNALVSEIAEKYRDDGEKPATALEMAKENAEHELTIAMNSYYKEATA